MNIPPWKWMRKGTPLFGKNRRNHGEKSRFVIVFPLYISLRSFSLRVSSRNAWNKILIYLFSPISLPFLSHFPRDKNISLSLSISRSLFDEKRARVALVKIKLKIKTDTKNTSVTNVISIFEIIVMQLIKDLRKVLHHFFRLMIIWCWKAEYGIKHKFPPPLFHPSKRKMEEDTERQRGEVEIMINGCDAAYLWFI